MCAGMVISIILKYSSANSRGIPYGFYSGTNRNESSIKSTIFNGFPVNGTNDSLLNPALLLYEIRPDGVGSLIFGQTQRRVQVNCLKGMDSTIKPQGFPAVYYASRANFIDRPGTSHDRNESITS